MREQFGSRNSPARALVTTTAADAVKERAVAALRVSIERILTLMRECDDPGRKRRLNDTLFAATQNLAAVMRAQSSRLLEQ